MNKLKDNKSKHPQEQNGISENRKKHTKTETKSKPIFTTGNVSMHITVYNCSTQYSK